MKTSLIICVSFVSFAFASSSARTDVSHSICFADYLQQIVRIAGNYEKSFHACDDDCNANRRPPKQYDLKVEVEQHGRTSAEACLDLNACYIITDSLGFFKCLTEKAQENFSRFLVMQWNASSVAIELSDQYNGVQKSILRCRLAAKIEYLSLSLTAYTEHMACVNGTRYK